MPGLDTPLLRITEYSDNVLRVSKHSMDLGSPLPSVPPAWERGSGVRGVHTADCRPKGSETLIQSRVSGVDSAERYPLTPSPALG